MEKQEEELKAFASEKRKEAKRELESVLGLRGQMLAKFVDLVIDSAVIEVAAIQKEAFLRAEENVDA